jgi:hypothetical protein
MVAAAARKDAAHLSRWPTVARANRSGPAQREGNNINRSREKMTEKSLTELYIYKAALLLFPS